MMAVGFVQVMTGTCCVTTVEIVRIQPPAKLPWSPPPSSNTYNDHTPLANCPLKEDNVVAYGAAGAGTGYVSAGETSVGWYVPVTSVPVVGSVAAAPSQKV